MESQGLRPPFTGGCACGAIRYECSAPPMGMGHCHCRDCQYFSGTGHISALVVPAGTVRVTGTPKVYESSADSGNRVTRSFCPVCGTPLFAGNEAHSDAYLGIYAGSLDDPSAFKPTLDAWMASAQPWDPVDPESEKYDGNV